MKTAAKIITLIAIAGLIFGVLTVEGIAKKPETTPGIEVWTGNGSENICDEGGSYHWILTPGGGDFELLTATLFVTYEDGSSTQTNGYRPGGGGGAIHFDVTGGKVESAYATYTYEGEPGNLVLTISHSSCVTTTTTEDTTTTTTEETTTTTEQETTTTTEQEITTTTTEQETTTTTEQETTTTTEPTTTTSLVTTTTEGTTTTSEPTTTTTEETTTTTEQVTTTTNPVDSTTTTTESGTTTTEPNTTTTETPSGGGSTTTIPAQTTTTDALLRSEYPFTGTNLYKVIMLILAGIAFIGLGTLVRKTGP